VGVGVCKHFCHKVQLEIVRNYIKFLLPHMKWKRCCSFKQLSLPSTIKFCNFIHLPNTFRNEGRLESY